MRTNAARGQWMLYCLLCDQGRTFTTSDLVRMQEHQMDAHNFDRLLFRRIKARNISRDIMIWELHPTGNGGRKIAVMMAIRAHPH